MKHVKPWWKPEQIALPPWHDVWESYPEITHEVPEERLKRRAEREQHSE